MWSEEQKTRNAFPGGHHLPGQKADIDSPTEGQDNETKQ
jgi:hypothetical protein